MKPLAVAATLVLGGIAAGAAPASTTAPAAAQPAHAVRVDGAPGTLRAAYRTDLGVVRLVRDGNLGPLAG